MQKRELMFGILVLSFLLIASMGIILAADDDTTKGNNSDDDTTEENESDDDSDDENETEDDEDEGNLTGQKNIEKNRIKEKNKFKFNSTEVPENCTKTGSVIKCDVGGEIITEITTEAKNVNISAETLQTLETLKSTLRETTEDIKIKIEVENSGNEDAEEKVGIDGKITDSQQEIIDTLVSQITATVENAGGEAKIKIEIQSEFKEARVMTVYAGNSGNVIIQTKGINASTTVQLYKDANGTLYAVSDKNETISINYLPDEVKEKIKKKTKAKLENTNMIINEEGEYEYEAEKEARFLGLFKVKEKMHWQIDAETGEVKNENAPWWGFLASDVEEDTDLDTDETGTFLENTTNDSNPAA